MFDHLLLFLWFSTKYTFLLTLNQTKTLQQLTPLQVHYSANIIAC